MDTRAEIARKAALHGGWIERTIRGLLAELGRYDMVVTTPETVARARWVKSHENGRWISRLTATHGAVLATIRHEGSLFYTWSLVGADGGGWKETEYAAQRAVRKALREAESHANTANEAAG